MQKLHLVMGGRVKDPRNLEFVDLNALDLVGVYPDFASAEDAWRASAQRTVDDAEMKYVIVHLHRLLQPDLDTRLSHGGAMVRAMTQSKQRLSQSAKSAAAPPT